MSPSSTFAEEGFRIKVTTKQNKVHVQLDSSHQNKILCKKWYPFLSIIFSSCCVFAYDILTTIVKF